MEAKEPRRIEIRAVCKCGLKVDLCVGQSGGVFYLDKDMTYICLNCGAEMRVQVADLQESTIINVIKEY